MMSQVKNCKVLVLCSLFLVALTGCKDKSDPYVNPGDTPDPQWKVTVENDMPTSMTMLVKVSVTDKQGTLAAFMGEDCCGVAEYLTEYGLYNLYISPAAQTSGDVQLRFYSPDLKRIFDAKEKIPFRNDTQLGNVAQPYTPTWTASDKL